MVGNELWQMSTTTIAYKICSCTLVKKREMDRNAILLKIGSILTYSELIGASEGGWSLLIG